MAPIVLYIIGLQIVKMDRQTFCAIIHRSQLKKMVIDVKGTVDVVVSSLASDPGNPGSSPRSGIQAVQIHA